MLTFRSAAALIALGVAAVLTSSELRGAGVGEAAPQATQRTVYAAVTEKSGTPVLDMTPADFEVKEGGKTQEIASVRIATTPLRVAMLIADRGTGQFQGSALRFVEAVLAQGEVSITGIIMQPERAADYTSNVDAIRAGLMKIGRRGQARPGAQLVETILETAKEIKKPGTRPVIIVMRSGGEATTPIRGELVREEIRKSGAVLYAVSTTGTQAVRASGAINSMDSYQASQANAASDAAEGAMTLAGIIGDGAKESGGRHEQSIATTLVPTMQQIASELVNQYEITYALAAGTKPSDRLAVTSKRKGLTVLAPSRIAN